MTDPVFLDIERALDRVEKMPSQIEVLAGAVLNARLNKQAIPPEIEKRIEALFYIRGEWRCEVEVQTGNLIQTNLNDRTTRVDWNLRDTILTVRNARKKNGLPV